MNSRGVARGGAEGARAPEFGRSVNPIQIRGGRLCPSHYCQPPRIQKAIYISEQATHLKHFCPSVILYILQEQSQNFSVTSFITKLYFQSCSVSVSLTGNRRNDTSIWHCGWGSTSMLQDSSQVWKSQSQCPKSDGNFAAQVSAWITFSLLRDNYS